MEKIKIMHCADVHGDLDALKIYSNYVKEKKPGMSYVTGDLINEVFSDEEVKEFLQYEITAKNLLETIQSEANNIGGENMMKLISQELFNAIATDTLEEGSLIEIPGKEQEGPSTKDLYDLLKNPQAPLSLGNATKQYLDARENREKNQEKYVKIAETSMRLQYEEMEKILEGTDCLVLPGNYDGSCLEDIMSERNMHKKSKTIKDIKITGYGSAKGSPSWIPEELREEFQRIRALNEKKEVVYEGSEAGLFMIEEDPEIALLHETPFNEEGLQTYIANEQPYIVLSGHMHEMRGINKLGENTHLIMPGKLGKAPAEIPELQELKTFVEIDLNKEGEGEDKILKLEKVTYHQIKENTLQPFMTYEFDEHGDLKSKNNFSRDCGFIGGWL